ncbi:unnamed protein product [Cylicostephanus goldi]|uniref:Uncharacterized protein n=1 Tax=Cylicostephanus goldi TaxID=71465 RepID=A0A3P7PTX3_CYLGO|nr:unnamed protein product [Cylicostephanus goldi]
MDRNQEVDMERLFLDERQSKVVYEANIGAGLCCLFAERLKSAKGVHYDHPDALACHVELERHVDGGSHHGGAY